MNIRGIATVLGLATVLGTVLAAAQEPATVARLVNLEGNVLVSQDDAMVAATNNERVAVGTRVLTMKGASVVVSYDVGCDVRLKENERFTVRLGECGVLAGEVVSLGPAPGAIGGGLGVPEGVSPIGPAILTVGIGIGLYELFKNPSVSPN